MGKGKQWTGARWFEARKSSFYGPGTVGPWQIKELQEAVREWGGKDKGVECWGGSQERSHRLSRAFHGWRRNYVFNGKPLSNGLSFAFLRDDSGCSVDSGVVFGTEVSPRDV